MVTGAVALLGGLVWLATPLPREVPEPVQLPEPSLAAVLPDLVAVWGRSDVVEAAWARVDGPGDDVTAGDVPAEVALGSLRKWTTAAVVISLVDDGTLALDAPVGRWLPAWEGRPEVTLRRLLSHTSGLPMRPPAGTCRDLGDLAACVDAIAGVPPSFEPGTRFGYSTTGFHVAARVAEVAGGADFETLFRQRLAGPLGLRSARFEAAGPGLQDMTGTLYLSPEDLQRFVRGVVSGEGMSGRWLSPEAVAVLHDGHTGGVPKVGTIPRGE